MEISGKDLDLRGAGDILGPTQAGHIKLIGVELYQELLGRALAAANGKPLKDDWRPELRLGVPAIIPSDYIPEEELRLRLYHRVADASTRHALDALEDEIEDRFGPPPEPMRNLLAIAWLRRQSRRLGVQRLDAGPDGVAVSFRGALREPAGAGWTRHDERLVLARPSEAGRDRIALAEHALEDIES
jgi:transcription-repair coupling factor (superfamily II helicase)